MGGDQVAIDQIVNFAMTAALSAAGGGKEDLGPAGPAAAAIAIHCASLLCAQWGATLDDEALLCLVAYSDGRAPWTTDQIRNEAVVILNQQLIPTRRPYFVINTVMESFLKPIFSQSRSSRVTASGRRMHYDRVSRSAADSDTATSQPLWTGKGAYSIFILHWALSECDVGTAEPLYSVPVKSLKSIGIHNQQALAPFRAHPARAFG